MHAATHTRTHAHLLQLGLHKLVHLVHLILHHGLDLIDAHAQRGGGGRRLLRHLCAYVCV